MCHGVKKLVVVYKEYLSFLYSWMSMEQPLGYKTGPKPDLQASCRQKTDLSRYVEGRLKVLGRWLSHQLHQTLCTHRHFRYVSRSFAVNISLLLLCKSEINISPTLFTLLYLHHLHVAVIFTILFLFLSSYLLSGETGLHWTSVHSGYYVNTLTNHPITAQQG